MARFRKKSEGLTRMPSFTMEVWSVFFCVLNQTWYQKDRDNLCQVYVAAAARKGQLDGAGLKWLLWNRSGSGNRRLGRHKSRLWPGDIFYQWSIWLSTDKHRWRGASEPTDTVGLQERGWALCGQPPLNCLTTGTWSRPYVQDQEVDQKYGKVWEMCLR